MDILTERTANILLDDDEDYDDQDGPIESRVHLKEDRRLTKSKSCRRRRRSSARFLQLSAGDTEDDDEQKERVPHDNLGEVYQNAIRMNAENRINASNSWNLNLIDHMDRFLMSSGQTNTVALEDTLGPVTGINFTKASCTLDASVKIYSYRVDDVHLTSYKVLANLNRTDSGKSKNTEGEGERTVKETSSDARDQRRVARTNAETLETNLGKHMLYIIHI